MPGETDLDTLSNLFGKILIFAGRPSVQVQIAAIAIALSVAWVLAKIVQTVLKKQFVSFPETAPPSRKRTYRQFGLTLFGYLILPLFCLLAISLARSWLLFQGQLAGILFIARWVSFDFCIYRLIIGLLYAIFPKKNVQRYHYRLLAPIFVLDVLAWILTQLIDLRQLARVVLISVSQTQITVGALFLATIGLYLWIDAIWGINDLIFRAITRYTTADPGPVEAVLILIRYFLIIIGVFGASTSLGLNATTIAAITGGLSVGIGFGLQEILSNFISGIVLLFEGALRPGDIVNLDGEISVVEHLNIRATTVRTLNNVEKIIPNQTFFTSSFTTYTGSDRRVRILLPVGASYNDDPETVIQLLLEVAKQEPLVLKEPDPIVFLSGFGDSSIDFNLAVWLDNPLTIPKVTSNLNRAIWKSFAEHNIEIPFPQSDLHLRSGIEWEKFTPNLKNFRPISTEDLE